VRGPFPGDGAAFCFPFCGILSLVGVSHSIVTSLVWELSMMWLVAGPDIENPAGVVVINSLIGPSLLVR